MPTQKKPLDNFPLVRTRDVEQVRQTLAKVYSKPTLSLLAGTKDLNARMNECQFENVQLAFGTYGASVCLEFPAVDRFIHLEPLCGSGQVICGRQSVSLVPSASAAISPDTGYRADYRRDYEHLVLKIDQTALRRKLAALTGANVNKPLQMNVQSNGSQSAGILKNYLPLLACILSEAQAPMPSWWVARTEQLLMVMFLCSHQHAYSHLLAQEAADCAPWQVRAAEDHIEANPQGAHTIESLAKITGVSALSLFRTFKKTRGYSPMEFAARTRRQHNGLI